MSARDRVTSVPAIQGLIDGLLAECRAELEEPLKGITADGAVLENLFRPNRPVDTAPIVDAAVGFLQGLDPVTRGKAQLPFESSDRRAWFNVHMNFFRRGLLLDDLSSSQRQLALGLLRSTLSARGSGQARDIMRLNELLAVLSDSPDEFGEWLYFVTIFGTPSMTEPWAWQLDGHHLNINCLVLGDHMVMTPVFMGSEPCRVTEGPFAGLEVMSREEKAGLDLIRALDPQQRQAAIQQASIMPGQLPAHLDHWIDGRMQAGAFKDNIVLPYQGVNGAALSVPQRLLLRTAVSEYLSWGREDHATGRLAEVDEHLDDTWFSWLGGTGDDDPFYYRIHSPVVLIEFDHHPGVVFDNVEPTRHHIHTIVRTPNNGDYGADLLARHYSEVRH